LTVIGVFAILPPRAQYTSSVMKGDERAQFALALAEARTIARPGDGQAVDELTHKLDDAQQKDWAIDFAVLASDRAKSSPTRWKALLAASTAYVDRFDVEPGLDFANRALTACEAIRATDPAICPSPDQIRMQLYQANLKAGVASHIDPRKDRLGFMKAGERGLLQIHLDTRDKERGSAAPTGSGSQGSATAP
ncbi:MAG: hypothetical protein ABI678_33490, partial [Kofleriaceae bacterium]